mmetsp:Transcript_5062/g.10675  ORF Transcript_5062/g.10675 Transcript_5062/m.10675 type:complete len:227 (+) Transcript_5062:489-1169(+)
MHFCALSAPSFLTEPRPKHCPSCSVGSHVFTLHTVERRSSATLPPLRINTFCPLHRRGGWSEHHAETPSFSCPIRTSPPWRQPLSARYCQVMQAVLTQHAWAQEAAPGTPAPRYGLRSLGQVPNRFSSSFHGAPTQGAIAAATGEMSTVFLFCAGNCAVSSVFLTEVCAMSTVFLSCGANCVVSGVFLTEVGGARSAASSAASLLLPSFTHVTTVPSQMIPAPKIR